MSSKNSNETDNDDNSSDDAEFPPDDGAVVIEELNVEPLVVTESKSRSGMVAWLALILAVLAMAALGFDFYRDRSALGSVDASNIELRTLSESLGATQNAFATLEQTIAAMEATAAAASAATTLQQTALEQQLNDRLRMIEAMPGRLSSVEASLAAVQGISSDARGAWLLAEAEYYLQIANAQLQLANNPELAAIALKHADDRILQLADPRLTGIRQALSDELRSLEAMTTPDIAGITLTLASLAGVVDSLPLRQEVVVREQSSETIDPSLTGVDRALASLKNALGGVVSVRRQDEAMQPLIAPEAQYFLRANLALQFQAARLALLRGEETIFRHSLDDADAWLEEYYDAGAGSVASARETISEIRGSALAVSIPDISLSLRLLRQFNTQARPAPARPAPARERAPEATPEPESETPVDAEVEIAVDSEEPQQ